MIENPYAIAGIKQMLAQFPDNEVISLCATVTQGLLKHKIQSREAAMDAIIKYSADTTSLLRRKLLTRNHLFEYLDSAAIKVNFPITKDELIDKIVQAWDTNSVSYNIVNKSEQETNSNIQPATACDRTCIQQEEISSTSLTVPSSSTTISTSDDDIVNIAEMAVQFCIWFYSMINNNAAVDSNHFFRNASIEVQLISEQASEVLEATNNGEEVAKLLSDVKVKHHILFNPNLANDGTKGKKESHGLVMIMCCGTLHINDAITGMFEQLFALARDPTSENNWKIKNSTLVLRSKNVTNVPKLGDEKLQLMN